MALEQADVEKIAKLAALEINNEAVTETTEMLNNILDLVNQMQAVDTKNVEPLLNPLEVTQRLRTDEVIEQNHREAYQEIAPAVDQGLYLVPKVID